MKIIPLPKNRVCVVDDEDFESLAQYRWQINKTGYVARGGTSPETKSRKCTILMHRVVAGAKRGDEVDHRNEDKLDNRRENLRLIHHSGNMMNRRSARKDSKSKIKGVSEFGDRWRVRAQYEGRRLVDAVYTTREAAMRAYDKAVHEVAPEFSTLHFNDGIWTDEQLAPFLCQNKQAASGYPGVTKKRNKWAAKMSLNGKTLNLGVFDTPEQAHAARQAAVQLHRNQPITP